MMKIAFAVAVAAAVLMSASLLVGTIPAEAQNLKMAQGVDVQIGRDRDRRRNDSDATVEHRRHRRPTAKLPHGDHYGRTARRPNHHAQRAPLRLIDNGRTATEAKTRPAPPGKTFAGNRQYFFRSRHIGRQLRRPYFSLIVRLISVPQLSQT